MSWFQQNASGVIMMFGAGVLLVGLIAFFFSSTELAIAKCVVAFILGCIIVKVGGDIK